MTNKLEQAARSALEALVDHGTAYLHHEIHYSEAITALREALANTRSSIRSTSEYSEQAEQEPVACDEWDEKAFGRIKRHFAAPVRTKDLTDEELWEAAKTAKSNDLTDAFRAVIAADREKNK